MAFDNYDTSGLLNSYYDELSTLKPLGEEIVEKGLVSTSVKKMINTTRSANEKAKLVEGKQFDKYHDISGSNRGFLDAVDPDSGFITDPNTGERIPVRFIGTGSSRDYFDALDAPDANKSEQAKIIHANYVSQLVGKEISQLTPEDYQNVKNYQNEELARLYSEEDYQYTPFDKNRVYTMDELPSMDVAYKIVGKDEYGRNLAEIYNPNTGRSLSFDMARNPLINVRNDPKGFDIYKTLDTVRNRKDFALFSDEHKRRLDDIRETFDTDGAIGEFADRINSALYQSGARLLKYTDRVLNAVGFERAIARLTDTDWEQITQTQLSAQEWGDLQAGVKPSTRRKSEELFAKSEEQWYAGDFIGALLTSAQNADSLIADSSTMLISSLAMAAVTGGTSLAAQLGKSALGKLALASMTALPAAIDVTLLSADQFKENNGYAMPASKIAEVGAINLALLIPEQFFLAMGLGRVFPKPIRDRIHSVYQLKTVPGIGKTLGVGAITGAATNAPQDIYMMHVTENQLDPSKKGFWDRLFSEEGAYHAMLGVVMNTTLAGVPAVARAPLSIRSDIKSQRARTAVQTRRETTTYSGEKVDTEASVQAIETAINLGTTEQDLTTINELIKNPTLSRDSINKVLAKKQIILEELARQGKLPENSSVEDLLANTVFHSDPFGMHETKGKLTEGETKRRLEQIKKFAEELLVGKTKEEVDKIVNKTLEQVSAEVRMGTKDFIGVETYENNINELSSRIDNLDPKSPTYEKDKALIERNRTGLINNLTRFRKLQYEKFRGIIDAANTIAAGDAVNVNIGGFEVRGLNLLRNSFRDNIGAYGVINSIFSTLKDADKILEPFNPNNEKELMDYGNLEKNMETFKDAVAAISKKTEEDLLRPPKSAITKIKEKITKKPSEPKPKVEQKGDISPDDTKAVLRALRFIADTPNAKAAGRALIALKAKYPNIESWNKFKEANKKWIKEKESKIIDEIISKKTEVTERLEKNKQQVADTIDLAEKLKSEYTQATINKVTNLDEYREIMKSLVDLASDIKSARAIDLTKDPKLIELWNYYKDFSNNLRVKRGELEVAVAKEIVESRKKAEAEKKVEEVKPEDTISESFPQEYKKRGMVEVKDSVEFEGTNSKGENVTIKYTVVKDSDTQFRLERTITDKNGTKKQIGYIRNGKFIWGDKDKTYNAEFFILNNENNILKQIRNDASNYEIFPSDEFGYKKIEKAKPIEEVKPKGAKKEVIAPTTEVPIEKVTSEEHITVEDRSYLLSEITTDTETFYRVEEIKPDRTTEILEDFNTRERAMAFIEEGAVIISPEEAGRIAEPSLDISKPDSLARKLFDTVNTYIKRMANAGDLVESLDNVDKTEELNELIKERRNALKDYDALKRQVESGKHEELAPDLERFHKDEIIPIEESIKKLITQLDNTTSRSILEGSKDKEINKLFPGLSDELEVTPNAITILGATKVNLNNKFIKGIVDRFNSLNFIPNTKDALRYLLLKDKDTGKLILDSAPQLRLMSTIVDTSTKTELLSHLEAIPEVAVAMDMALRYYFTSIDINQELTPFKADELKERFGENVNIHAARKFTQTFGTAQTVIATKIGTDVLQILGIKLKSDGTKDFDKKVAAGIGSQALRYAELNGWVKLVTVDGKTTNKASFVNIEGKRVEAGTKGAIFNVLDNQTPMVIFNSDIQTREDGTKVNKTMEKVKKGVDLLEPLKIDNIYERKPTVTPSHVSDDMRVQNTNNLMKVPEYVKNKVMKKLFRTPFIINHRLVDFIKENRPVIEAHMGLQDKASIAQLPLDAQEGAKGINLSVTKQIDDLLEMAGWKAPFFYFKWFFSKNGRIFNGSNHVNPQQNKSLQRFLVVPRDSERTFDKTNVNQINEFYFTLAQAFDIGGTDTNIEAFGKAILKVDSKVLWDKFKEKKLIGLKISEDGKVITDPKYKGKTFKLGIENLSQVLLVLQTIEDYQATPEGGSFKTYVAVENDSTTSGYFITFLQHPDASMLAEYASKVGILEGDELPFTEIHNLKKQIFNGKRFLDIYQTIASKIVAPSSLYTKDIFKGLPKDLKDSVKYLKLDVLNEFYTKTLYSALPKLNPDGTVSSELRKLVKSPTMTYNYGQGIKSLVYALGEDITTQLITDFVAIMNGTSNLDTTKQEAIKNVFNHILTLMPEHKGGLEALSKLLMTEFSANIKLQYKGITTDLNTFISTTISASYGKAVWNALDSSFGKTLNEINASKNMMFNTMFDLFKKEYDYEVAKLKEQRLNEKKKYTNADEEGIINSLFSVMPVMRLAYDLILESGVMSMNTERIISPENTVKAIFNRNGKIGTTNVTANIRQFIAAGSAGAILPTHFIDGMAMAMMMEKYGHILIPIHDAIVGSGIDSRQAIQDFNKTMYLLCKDYNMYSELFDRYKQVLNNVQNRWAERGDESDVSIMPIHNKGFEKFFYNEETDIETGKKSKIPLTITQFQSRVDALVHKNNANRDAFYNKINEKTGLPVERFITNVDGVKGSGWTVDPNESIKAAGIQEALIAKRRDPNLLGSDPFGHTPNETIDQLKRQSLGFTASVNARLKIGEALRKADPKKIDDKTFNHLMDVVINRVNPERLSDLTITTVEDIRTTGTLAQDEITVRIDNQMDMDTYTRLSPFTFMSAVEVYAHELLHAGIRVPIKTYKEAGLTKEVHELLELQRKASRVITWETFMPSEFDPSLKDLYETNSKKVWDYIFNNPNIDTLDGLQEFVAYGLTHKPMMDKLDSVYIDVSNQKDKVKFIDRLISLGVALLDMFEGRGNIKTLLSRSAKVLKGDLNLRNRQTMLVELAILNDKLNGINQKATNKLYSSVNNTLERITGFIGDLIRAGEKVLSPPITKAMNFADEFGLTYEKTLSGITGSWAEPIKIMEWILLTPFSKSRKSVLPTVLKRTLNISQQGLISTIIRDIQEPDMDTSILETMAAINKTVEGASKSLEGVIYQNLDGNFYMYNDKGERRDLTDHELKSLTKSSLYTDFSNIAVIEKGKVTNIDEMIDYLKDENKIDAKIESLRKELRSLIKDKEQFNWYMTSGMGLAYFMTTGKGMLGLNTNARNIARGMMTGHSKWANVSEEVITKLDNLITFYALKETDINDRYMTATLDKNGIANMLLTQDEFIKDSRKEEVINPVHEIKGYSKSILDGTIDVKVAPLAESKEMRKLGYSKIKTLGSNEFTGRSGYAIYKRTWNTSQRREGAAFLLTAVHAIGNTLKEEAFAATHAITKLTGKESTMKEAFDLHKIFFDNANTKAASMIKLMQKRELNMKEISKLSERYGGYMPIVSPNGGISDFRIMMSTKDKVEHLKMNENAFSILSKMYASKNTKIEAGARNQAIVSFLENDMYFNMIEETRKTKEGKDYIRLSEDTKDPFLKEAFKAIPKELKAAIKKYNSKKYGTEGKGFWVREEWLPHLMGSPSISVIDNKTVSKWTNAHMKKFILVAEHIMKHVAYFSKQNIVIRNYKVLLGNIISNIGVSIAKGASPARVFQKTIQNARWIRDYVDNKKTLEKIKFKQKLGTATQEELGSINWYQSKLDHNPVDVLMKKGMYQSIVEDISPKELDAVGKINRLLAAKMQNAPRSAKFLFKHFYLMEGNPYYDFMFQATQYSDFVARATEYQLQMEKLDKKKQYDSIKKEYDAKHESIIVGEKLTDKEFRRLYEQQTTFDVWNAFINYDKPQSSKEQWLNDMGLVMFTKFLKRIQHVITKGFAQNPISSLLFIFFQLNILDTSDIFEYFPTQRDITWNMFNPLFHFTNAIIPVPIQFMTDTGMYGSSY